MQTQVKSIPKKSEDLSAWYNDVIEKAKIAEHGPVRGTVILRPLGYALWEEIQKYLDKKIKELGSKNAYFPLFIPNSLLDKEKKHVEGFSPELAVVTHAGGEKLSEPVVVRPTSETIMYDAYSRWIHSFRDLPLIINQWNNVVRWEKRPYLFLRTTEFLWQEGHGAHATSEENQKMVDNAMTSYVDTYKEVLAIYGYRGKKSETEKFAGADSTLTFEVLSPDGKVIQACTSHNLGQNFSKVFNIKFQDEKGQEQYVWQNSWGYSTRSLGALILVHGDDNGLILPPNVAPVQVRIIPIVTKTSDNHKIEKLAKQVFENLKSHEIRTELDQSNQSPGWKFNQTDLEGVPLRIEIGSTEVNSQEVRVVRRDTKEAANIKLHELAEGVKKLLENIQNDLYEKSKKMTLENTRAVKNYEEFKEIMKTKRGFIEAFWCEDEACEVKIKEETKATTRCLPLEVGEAKGTCVYCGKEAKHRWLFGQSY